ncbi:hypothetical protein [Silvimonas amylolytica]|uniref:Uncharacterized protein n=1 Tax=Silvimonas amylolytica TaxID=449663 RepID=A0ABQ2PI25_9NEIS|nr:hypothetical protein [Silvimonas amylolytica]GGP24891.1 hypothetical protein GCM10010971_07100 [Silvimonas amylolytica]
MADEYSEPGKLVLSILDLLIQRVKSTRPINTNGKELSTGFVYSQLVLGMPCNPQDYMNPWTPTGTVQDAVKAQPNLASPAGTPAGTPAPAVDSTVQHALNAAWKTSRLVDTMLMVTNDDSYLEYGAGGRHLSFAYEGIITAMQSTDSAAVSPDVAERVKNAEKVLFELDPSDGSIIGKSKLYKNYTANALAYANAKSDLAEKQAEVLGNPATAASWPQMAERYQQQVDIAWDTFKTEGADKVEAAVDVRESVGISMENHMIARAKDIFDKWNLAGLSGVAERTPYAFISPSDWADPQADTSGWQGLSIDQRSYNSRSSFQSADYVKRQYKYDASASSGGGGVAYFGFGAYGSGGNTSLDVRNTYQSQDGSSYQFHNDAKNLSISLEYALCSVDRPWFIGDLFYLHNWYLRGNKKNSISDGTVAGMLHDSSGNFLLPMIPTQFLAVRNITISATQSDWGQDGQTLHKMYTDSKTHAGTWTASGGGGFSCGIFTIGGHGSHSSTHTDTSLESISSDDTSSASGWSFDGEKLEIRGTQIIAWLSELLPPAPTQDAPPV